MGAKSIPQLDLEGLWLSSGAHGSRDKGVCLLEAVAWMSGELHSDHPDCACPVLATFGRQLNDLATDDERQLLKPLIPKLVNSRRDKDVELKRGYFFADRAVRFFLPIYRGLIGEEVVASQLEGLAEIVDEETARSAIKILESLALDLARALDLDRALNLYRALDLARALARALDLALDRDLARALARALALALDRASPEPSADAGSARSRMRSRQEIFGKSIEVFEQAIAIGSSQAVTCS